MNDIKLEVGQRLYTKDGRRVGNAIVVDVLEDGKYTIESDFGNVSSQITLSGIEEYWHIFGYYGDKEVCDIDTWKHDRFEKTHKSLLKEGSDLWVMHISARCKQDALEAARSCAETWVKYGDACEGTNIFKESSFKVYKIQ